MPTLYDYAQMLKGKKCVSCLTGNLAGRPVRRYDHVGGYSVDGFEYRQWLSVKCPTCGYECSLWKLEIPGKATMEEQEQEIKRREYA